jgi:serine/threonine-protein kinase/endoribonuclease IRE1
MERDPPESTLIALEESSTTIVGDDWSKAIDRTLLDNLGKYRKYDGKSVRDLLRVLRNKVRSLMLLLPRTESTLTDTFFVAQKHHYQDLPENVRKNLGDLPGGFLSYFTARFPRLLLHVFDVVADHLSEEAMFKSTFSIAEDEQ